MIKEHMILEPYKQIPSLAAIVYLGSVKICILFCIFFSWSSYWGWMKSWNSQKQETNPHWEDHLWRTHESLQHIWLKVTQYDVQYVWVVCVYRSVEDLVREGLSDWHLLTHHSQTIIQVLPCLSYIGQCGTLALFFNKHHIQLIIRWSKDVH